MMQGRHACRRATVARRVRPLLLSLFAFVVVLVTHVAAGANAASKPLRQQQQQRNSFVAPNVLTGLSTRNQQYLIGVVSFAVVAVACVLAVGSLMKINYDDDTLLMVEVPEESYHEE